MTATADVFVDEIPIGIRPPLSWFTDPGFTSLTPITVDGHRVYGHIGDWRTPHIGYSGRPVYLPRSTCNYKHFLRGAVRVDDNGTIRTAAVGHLTAATSHAHGLAAADATARHYDHSGFSWAYVAAGDDEHGVWVSGMLAPGVTDEQLTEALAHPPSGDWRPIRGELQMVGVLHVNVPGFPVDRARVASGQLVSLVASGEQPRMLGEFIGAPSVKTFGRAVDPGWAASSRGRIENLSAGKLTSGTAGARVEIAADGPVRFFGADGTQTHPSPTDFADLIAARLDERKTAAELSAAHTALLSELDDTPAVVASLLDEVDDTGTVVASLLAEVDDTPQEVGALLAALDDGVPADLGELDADDVEALGRLDRSPKKNWVEEQGGLPDYIDRIANHLHGKGMGISRSIATAIAAAKKMCSTGDLNWPGLQQVNPGSKAQACAAVAQWEAMKKAARAD